MADFRQLALEYVLADDGPTLNSIARQAANEIGNASSTTNPVARWVEAVQPWMPGGNGDDAMEDSGESTDWTARAKALEFLSQTLDFLSKDVLKPSQVRLLIGFFGAMFDVDHKAGVLPSASALMRIVEMKSFQPQSAVDILTKICALKDDFLRQISKTRLAVYQLIRVLVTNPAIVKDLRKRDGEGAPSQFMLDLLNLCKNERDPDCLMAWFDVLRFFAVEYEPTQEVLEQVYETFKAYFPITLPRTSPSGITPEDLKLRLRSCFSSNQRLSSSVFPFLLGRLDQGDGVTVNVKLDVLKTIKACLETYQDSTDSIAPYVNQIWGSLKYEVRNGEIEDTIWATLEVLKTLATRLGGDDLRDYTLTVTRDCINDLSNPIYTASAGRLLISVLSANPSAFVLMIAPTITHIKENLRHPKSPKHTQDLLKLLHVLLESRLLIVDSKMTLQESSDFEAVDVVFKSLYPEVLRTAIALGLKEGASFEDFNIASQAVQGAGALVCQKRVKSGAQGQDDIPDQAGSRLIPDEACSDICDTLFTIAIRSRSDTQRTPSVDELVNEATKALQRASMVYTQGFKSSADNTLTAIHSAWSGENGDENEVAQLGSLLSFIACFEMPSSSHSPESLHRFLACVLGLTHELIRATDAGAPLKVRTALVASLQSAVRYFNDACSSTSNDMNEVDRSSWITYIVGRYPDLDTLSPEGEHTEPSPERQAATASTADVRRDFLLICLFVIRRLYRSSTQVLVAGLGAQSKRIELNPELSGDNEASVHQYLTLLSGLAGFVVRQLSEQQQLALRVDRLAVQLFHEQPVDAAEDSTQLSETTPQVGIMSRANVLALGLLESLRPSAVSKMFERGAGSKLITDGLTPGDNARQQDVVEASVSQSILAILANKQKIETDELLLHAIEAALKGSEEGLQQSDPVALETSFQTGCAAIALVAGMLRRYPSKQASGLLQFVKQAPRTPEIGTRIARRLEVLILPQDILAKVNFAQVKLLWMQKAYADVVKPMLEEAVLVQGGQTDPLVKSNMAVGVLLMTKHIKFSIYEDDVSRLLRLAIATSQTIGKAPETVAALEVIREIIVEAHEHANDHVRSLVNICVDNFSSAPKSQTSRPGWLPADYYSFSAGLQAELEAKCGKLALEILGGLPGTFESRFLLPQARQVQRELMLACGHRVRDVRRSARVARAAWANVN